MGNAKVTVCSETKPSGSQFNDDSQQTAGIKTSHMKTLPIRVLHSSQSRRSKTTSCQWLQLRLQVCVFLVIMTSVCGCRPTNTPAVPATSEANELELAHRLFAGGDHQQAEAELQRWLIKYPDDRASIELLADIESASGDDAAAISRYRELLNDTSTRSPTIAAKLLPLAIKTGGLHVAIETLEILAKLSPDDPQPHKDLSKLLVTAGEWPRAREHARWLIQHGMVTPYELQLVAAVRAPPHDASQLAKLKELNPNDTRLDLGRAQQTALAGDWAQVVTLTEPIVRQHPDQQTALALYGRALAESGRNVEFDAWRATTDQDTQQRADYWLAIAARSLAEDQPAQAAAACLRAVAIDDDDMKTLNNFVAALLLCDAKEAAASVAQRQHKLLELRSSIQGFQEWRFLSQRNAISAAEQLLRLGRYWEALAWSNAAIRMPADLVPDVTARKASVQAGMGRSMPWSQPFLTQELITQFQSASQSTGLGTQVDNSERVSLRRKPDIKFESEAGIRGLDFWGNIGVPKGEPGIMIYQTPGCGIAVSDFDIDGSPDLYVIAAGGTVMQSDSETNRLFRNRGGHFADVTAPSSSTDFGCGQGVCSGDYNEDGFPDLVVGNIGPNQLLRNNGDGTYSNVSAESNLNGKRWTTSVAIADFSGDGISDLVELNYMSGFDWATEKCQFPQINDHRSCAPSMFAAARDRFWIGNGDGTFREFDPPSIRSVSPARGLGLVIGSLDDQPGNDIFVANDTSANHFWSFSRGDASASADQSPSSGDNMVEIAGLRGLAVGYNGSSQGCMGVGVNDWDHDGDADLYVTNFENESDAFYEQIHAGVWSDRVDQRGLRDVSHPMVGFGCEFADFDNDGNSELITTNGNVDDMTFDGSTFRLPTRVFWADRDSKWRHLHPDSLGTYFNTPRVGRALVTADFNRDHKVDVAISHLDDDLALLINKTENAGNSLSLRLIGTTDARDAIGTKITIHCENGTQSSFVTAGDGYLCTNESVVRFGIGDSDQVDHVEIRWPNGSETELHDIPAGDETVAVQTIQR